MIRVARVHRPSLEYLRFHVLFFFFLLAFLLSGRIESESKPNILLITIDTLRADHLGCYGYKSNTSPNLDQFAKQGILFQNAYSAVPLTLPSHATILSGFYPKKHGIRDNAHFPLTDSPLIQESLKQLGYHTAAFISGATLSSKFGLNRGFDFYDDEFQGTERKANETTIRVLQWLKNAPAPYFLWVHYFDPHAEYESPNEFSKKFPASPYDGEIAFVDSEIPKLLNAVGTATFVLITADHGESLGEHGETTHAVFLYNATLHVPLLIRGPEIKPAIKSDPVSLSDIAPTFLELASKGREGHGYDGVSLFANSKGRNLFAESLYAQRNFGYAPLYACIRENKKYIQAPQAEFYDLQADPTERLNLIKERKIVDWQMAVKGYSKEEQSSPEQSLSSEEQEQLRSLGYVSTSVVKVGTDPKLKMQVIERFRQGMILLQKEQYKKAEAVFEEISTTEKHNGLAFRFLGDALSAQQKYAEAANAYLASFQRLADPEVAVQLAKAYNRLQEPGKAEKLLQSTVKRFPHYYEAIFELASFYASQNKWEAAFDLVRLDLPEFHNQRGLLYLQKNEPQEALTEFLEALKSKPKAAHWNNIGIAYQRLNQLPAAEKAYKQALHLNPDYEECEANLAFLFVQQKRWQEAMSHLLSITSKNQKLWRARLALGFVLENLGKQQDALTIYQKLLAEVPFQWPERPQLEARIRILSQ